jgi:hypothetical protein
MYFRNVICTVALATLASAAVAKQIPTPYSSMEDYGDAVDDELFERDAEAEAARTAAWEQAHGGAPASYHYGDEHDAAAWHVARDAKAEPGWLDANGGQPPAWFSHLKSKATEAAEAVKSAVPLVKPFTKQSGGLKKHHGDHKHDGKHARDVDGEEVEEFDGEDEVLYARDFNDPVPDFGDQDFDTSLDGYLETRDVEAEEDFEDEPENPDLTGYDEEILQRRSDGTADDVDYSLEGYEVDDGLDAALSPIVHARDLNEDDEYDAYLNSEEHRSMLESIGVTKRSAADDQQDEDEFHEELYTRQDEADFVDDDEADYEDLQARDIVDEEQPEYDIDEEDNEESPEEVQARDIVDDGVEEYDIEEGVDVSLEGLEDGPVYARSVDDESIEDSGDAHDESDADAAYDNEPVVEELVAPPLG